MAVREVPGSFLQEGDETPLSGRVFLPAPNPGSCFQEPAPPPAVIITLFVLHVLYGLVRKVFRMYEVLLLPPN
jgi:hypothetical protein